MAGISRPPTNAGPRPREDATECPECGAGVRQNRTETLCERCGVVIDSSPIDHGPDWYSHEGDDGSHVGASLSVARHDLGLSSEIGYGTDGQGEKLSGRKRKKMFRLREMHSRARFDSKRDRNRMCAFYDIRRMCSALGVSKNVRDRACSIFAEAHAENLVLGRSLEFVSTGAVYAACKLLGTLVVPADIGAVSQLDANDAVQALRFLSDKLSLGIPMFTPADHVPRLASELGLTAVRERAALTLARDAETAGLTNGMKPSAFAAAVIYVVSGARVTQERVADAAGVTPVTLRRHAKNIQSAGLAA
jgi:transcription initiation factor TFIIB